MSERAKEMWERANGYFNPSLATFSSSASYRGSRSWLAKITGEDDTYKFKREFLETTKIDGVRHCKIDSITPEMILEKGSNYFTGSRNKHASRDYYLVQEITEEAVVVKKIKTESEVLDLLNGDRSKVDLINEISNMFSDLSYEQLESIRKLVKKELKGGE